MALNLDLTLKDITPLLLASTSYCGMRGDALSEYRPNADCSVPPANPSRSNGSITDSAPINLSSFTDGTASTLLVAERSVTAFRPLNTPGTDANPGMNPYTLSGWWFSGWHGDSLITAAYPPNAFKGLKPLSTNSDAWINGGLDRLNG